MLYKYTTRKGDHRVNLVRRQSQQHGYDGYGVTRLLSYLDSDSHYRWNNETPPFAFSR